VAGRKNIAAAMLALVLAIGLGATRTEKLWAELAEQLRPQAAALLEPLSEGAQHPFDPRRVPQSGGQSGRLLAGIAVAWPSRS
jgi:hypothetical protein